VKNLTNPKELQEFLSAPESTPPRWVADEVALAVRRDLEPHWAGLLAKVLGLHLVAGSISLLICPQFGVGAPMSNNEHASPVMSFLMPYGDIACALGCGGVFSLLTAVCSVAFLTRDERRHVASRDLWIFSALMALSWGGLMLSGRSQMDLTYGLIWLFAATLGAQSVFRTVDRTAKRLAALLPL